MWHQRCVRLHSNEYKQSNKQHTFLRMSATCFGYLNVATIRLYRTIERKRYDRDLAHRFICKKCPLYDSAQPDDGYVYVAEVRKNICCVFECIHFHKTKIYIFSSVTIFLVTNKFHKKSAKEVRMELRNTPKPLESICYT
jgi:hypothetical protein